MTTPDLTPTHREALNTAIAAHYPRNFLSVDELEALLALRDACPDQPRLEDGIYETPDSDGDYRLRYVRDGHYSRFRNPDGTLIFIHPLPADVSTWRRIDGPPTVTPEQLEEAARAVSGYPGSSWGVVSEETKDYYRNFVRKAFAAAGIEVSEP